MSRLFLHPLVVVLLLAVASHARHIQFYLNGYECFYQHIDEGTRASVEYAPISGSQPHVDCTVEDPSGNVFYRQEREDYDMTRFLANKTGVYRVCFSNIYDFSMYSNVVYLDFVVGNEGSMPIDSGEQPPKVMTQLETSLVNIHDFLRIAEMYQNNNRIRAANGMLVAEGLNAKTMWRSLGQTMVILAVGIIQVIVLRRFFTAKKEEI